MRVIHVALGKANPDRMNGVNRVVHNLATYQRRAGNDVEVWGITPTPDDPTFAREYRLRLFAARGTPWVLDAGLRAAINEVDTSAVVHFHGGWMPEFFKLSRIMRRTGQPYIITPHGAYNPHALRKRGWAKWLYLTFVERSLIKGASVVHCIGRSELENTIRIFPNARAVLIPNGIDPSEVSFDAPPVQVRTRPLFGYCGRIDNYYKGVDLLIDGFLQYRRGLGEGELWIIGDGPDLPELKRRVAEAGEAGSVLFWGERYGSEKLSLLAEMDAFLHPSRSDVFPGSILEAAALGKCLVVSDRTNTEEYVEHYGAGFILRKGTSEEITDVLHELQRVQPSGECARLGVNSLRMIEKELNWDNISCRVLAIYKEGA
jgi:glycosyltransferase involved in cell wall biosynthesis